MQSVSRRSWGVPGGSLDAALLLAVAIFLAILSSSSVAMATIVQGDFSFFGDLSSAWSGRWGEGSARGGTLSRMDNLPPPFTTVVAPGQAPTATGGSFDFNHWDLVEARQTLDFRTDDHIVKSYKLLDRMDTLILEDARLYAGYVAFYDAFPDLKHKGRAETARDWGNFSGSDRINEFTRNELREYYAQLDFTDNFSVRVGKQQVIWSEVDAFSGTEVTNPVDYRFGNLATAALSSDSRVNLRMVRFTYILPDFYKTASNGFEFLWIPGDFEGSVKANISDARNPWIPPVPLNLTLFNQVGQPFREGTLMDQGATPLFPFVIASQQFGDLHTIITQNKISNSIDNSEFGARYSTLLPIGGGLQTSLIYLYEARSNKLSTCVTCPPPPGTTTITAPGIFFLYGVYDFGPPLINNNLGTIRLFLRNEFVRQSFFGMTGTYYDNDLTDVVYRYDFFYSPKVVPGGGFGLIPTGGGISGFSSQPKWGEESRWIVAADRPTYIPWISKQHTILTAQYSATWDPDPRGTHALSSTAFVSALDYLMDGRLTALNVFLWDIDHNVGFLSSGGSYRYSRNVLFDADAIWFLGRSGLSTGLAGIFSRAQRINGVTLSFVYEL